MTMESVLDPGVNKVRVQMHPLGGTEATVDGKCKENSSGTCVWDEPCELTFMMTVALPDANVGQVFTHFEDENGNNIGDGPTLTSGNGDAEIIEWDQPVTSECEGSTGPAVHLVLETQNGMNMVPFAEFKVYCSECETIRT